MIDLPFKTQQAAVSRDETASSEVRELGVSYVMCEAGASVSSSSAVSQGLIGGRANVRNIAELSVHHVFRFVSSGVYSNAMWMSTNEWGHCESLA